MSEESSPTSYFTVANTSLFLCAAIAVFGLLYPNLLTSISQGVTGYFLKVLDWFFLFFCSLCMIVCIALAFTPYGKITLGKKGEKPEFSTPSWIAMLFAAGMGAGLLFWGVAEPMSHFVSPPDNVEGMTPEAARQAMVYANLHWGLHAWGIYGIGALVLAYFGFRKGYPLLPSGPIRAVAKGKTGKRLGDLADLVGVLSVVFGVAGSLGMGVMQITSGLSAVFGSDERSMTIWLIVLTLVTICYLISAVTGISKGIQLLSNINIVVAIILMLFILFSGPTSFIMGTFVTSLGDYLTQVPSLSFRLHVFSGETEWSRLWTLTYLLWWAAWIPFVGVFIARISRGRTIRQFVTGVIVIPTLFTCLWFSVFGGSGIYIELFCQGGVASLLMQDVAQTIFGFFEFFPLSKLLSGIALLLIFIFLVTSADSASFVVGMLSRQGELNPPPREKLFWGVVIAMLTASSLLAGGNVTIMKAIAISGSIPFVFIAIAHIGILLKVISQEDPEKEVME